VDESFAGNAIANESSMLLFGFMQIQREIDAVCSYRHADSSRAFVISKSESALKFIVAAAVGSEREQIENFSRLQHTHTQHNE